MEKIEKKTAQEKEIDLEEVKKLIETLFHAHYGGNVEQWFSYLHKGSIYLGTGEPLLIGGDVIREHFKGFEGKAVSIIEEEYIPFSLGPGAAQVCGQIIVENQNNLFQVINHFTITCRLIGDAIKIVHLHNSYEYMQLGQGDTLKLDINTMQFVRNLLLNHPARIRLPIRSGTQTIFINPDTILYVQGQRKRTELVCIDRVVACNSSMGEMIKILPKTFYPLHRSYLVNTQYIVAVRRFEVELISGICLPIPALTYQKAKRELQEIIQGNGIKIED